MTLYEKLKRYNEKGYSSFHTPGHKCSGFFDGSIIDLDLTELPDTYALFEAEGIIKEEETLFSELYGSAASFISAGGCTLAIQAMIRTAYSPGGKILCARNAHRSAVNAMALLGIDPVWLYPKGTKNYTGRIDPADVERELEACPSIKACYITSPSYYGEISDIRSIADICHRYGVILLVDNAHGSHLAFMKENMHPLYLGADMTACSLHKTMPVMTGGALLNVRTKELAENAKEYMSLFASTSPSYVIMSSLSLCAEYMISGKGREDYLRCEEEVGILKKLAAEKGISSPDGLCDPLRFTLDTAKAGLAGESKQQEFFHRHNIECEFCDGENAVLIFTPFNSKKDFDRVRSAINELGKNKAKEVCRKSFTEKPPEKVMTLRQAVLSPSEKIPVRDSAGRIASDTACPCPPGVPLIMPGERIDEDIAHRMEKSGIAEISVIGKL